MTPSELVPPVLVFVHVVEVEVIALFAAAAAQLGGQRLHGGHELLLLLFVLFLLSVLVAVKPVDKVVHSCLESLAVLLAERVLVLFVGQLVLQAVRSMLPAVARLNFLLLELVLFGKLLGLLNHALDLLLGQTALVVGDGDFLGRAACLVLGLHVEDTVGVNLESHVDLRLSTRRGGNTVQLKPTQLVAVLGHGAFALEHLNQHGLLVVLVCGENLVLLSGDNRVAVDELRHDTADSLDTHGEWADVKQQNRVGLLAALTRQHTTLNSGTVRDGLVGVDTLVRLLAVEEVLQQLLHLRDASGAADQDELVNLILTHVTVLHDLVNRAERLAEEVVAELFEAGAGERLGQILAIVQRLDLDTNLVAGRQGALGLLDLAAELLD